jgi:hypothetical protein
VSGLIPTCGAERPPFDVIIFPGARFEIFDFANGQNYYTIFLLCEQGILFRHFEKTAGVNIAKNFFTVCTIFIKVCLPAYFISK